jgi:hypothetical protein
MNSVPQLIRMIKSPFNLGGEKPVRGFGILVLIIGAIGIMLALSMDTSVINSAGARVNDLNLMADRQLYILAAGAIIIAGTLMAALSGIRKKLASLDKH